MTNRIVLSIPAIVLLLLAPCGILPTAALADGAVSELIPEDTCIIELTLPPGAMASVDGDNYSAQREFVSTGLEPRRIYETTVHVRFAHGKPVHAPILRKGGERIRLALQDSHAPQPTPHLQFGHRGEITCVAFSPDGRRILTGSDDQTMMLWDTESGKLLRVFVEEGGAIECLAFSSDGRQAVCGGDEGTVVLWDVATGAKLRTFAGHEKTVHAVAFSPDGRLVLTGSEDTTAILWDASTGARLRTLLGHTRAVHCALFSPDGRLVLTGSGDSTAVLWDTASGIKRRTLPHDHTVACAGFSADGGRVLTGTASEAPPPPAPDAVPPDPDVPPPSAAESSPPGATILPEACSVILWDTSTGAKLRTFDDSGAAVRAVAFSQHGRQILTSTSKQTAILWDASSGAKLHSFEGETSVVNSVAFSPDGRQVLTGSEDGKAIVWDATEVGKSRNISQPFPPSVLCAAVSPDGTYIVAGDEDGSVVVWDTRTGRPSRFLRRHSDAATCAVFTPDGRQLLTGSRDTNVILWDASTWNEIRRLCGHADGVTSIACSPDGQQVVTSSLDDTAILWATATGDRLRTFEGHSEGIMGVAFSPEGDRVLTGAKDKSAILWDVASAKEIRRFEGHSGGVTCVAFGLEGDTVLTGSNDNTVITWDAATGQQLNKLGGHSGVVTTATLSPDGLHVFSTASRAGWLQRFWERMRFIAGSGSNFAGSAGMAIDLGRANTKSYFLVAPDPEYSGILWDPISGRRRIPVMDASVKATCCGFSSDSRYAVAGTADGKVQLIDVLAGRPLLALMSLNGGEDWLALTDEGLFDGSPGGREHVSYRIGKELTVVPVDRFIQDFYRPGLLAEIWRGERPLPAVEIGKSLPPVLKIVAPIAGTLDTREVAVTVEAQDQGGGISGPWLMQNDARVAAPFQETRREDKLCRRFTISLVEGENRLLVWAASRDGSWESEPAAIVLRYDKPVVPPELYLVAVGIGSYADESMKVRFAAQDARDILQVFKDRGADLYGHDRIHLFPLVDQEATKERLKKTLTEELAPRAKPQDIFVLFLAGHGALVGQRYYFIPYDFKSASVAIEDEIRKQGLPQDELEDWIATVPALKRVLIYDTCHSGGVITASRFARDPFALQKTLEQMSRSSGSFIVAATAAGDEALDIQDLGHGALSYALLAGLGAVDRGPLKDRSVQPKDRNLVTVRDWFGFAQDEVPSLTRSYHRREQFVYFLPGQTNFPILPLGKSP